MMVQLTGLDDPLTNVFESRLEIQFLLDDRLTEFRIDCCTSNSISNSSSKSQTASSLFGRVEKKAREW